MDQGQQDTQKGVYIFIHDLEMGNVYKVFLDKSASLAKMVEDVTGVAESLQQLTPMFGGDEKFSIRSWKGELGPNQRALSFALTIKQGVL